MDIEKIAWSTLDPRLKVRLPYLQPRGAATGALVESAGTTWVNFTQNSEKFSF